MPLTVVQILWVNIIMDTFAAMAMASLPPNPEVMLENPVRATSSSLRPAWPARFHFQGGIMVAVLLGMLFWWTITEGGLTVRQRTLFSTFVSCSSEHVQRQASETRQFGLYLPARVP